MVKNHCCLFKHGRYTKTVSLKNGIIDLSRPLTPKRYKNIKHSVKSEDMLAATEIAFQELSSVFKFALAVALLGTEIMRII